MVLGMVTSLAQENFAMSLQPWVSRSTNAKPFSSRRSRRGKGVQTRTTSESGMFVLRAGRDLSAQANGVELIQLCHEGELVLDATLGSMSHVGEAIDRALQGVDFRRVRLLAPMGPPWRTFRAVSGEALLGMPVAPQAGPGF
jgi:hypothetical protein